MAQQRARRHRPRRYRRQPPRHTLCRWCGSELHSPNGPHRRADAEYCSHRCGVAARRHPLVTELAGRTAFMYPAETRGRRRLADFDRDLARMLRGVERDRARLRKATQRER